MWCEYFVARNFLAVCFAFWVMQIAAGMAYGQSRGHHRRHRGHPPAAAAPMAQAQPGVAQPVQPVAQPSDSSAQDELTARQARGTGAAAYAQQDWQTCTTSYMLSLTVANGAFARPEARLNVAICFDASGRPAQALEQLTILRESGQLPPGTDSEALEARIATVRRHAEQAAQPQRVVPSALICAGIQRACGGVCVDIQNDVRNCGGCGGACPAGNVCSAGTCHAVSTTQPTNTGSIRRTAGIALIAGGSAVLAGGLGILFLGLRHRGQADDLRTNGCDVPVATETCFRLPMGSTDNPANLAGWQLPLGSVLTGAGAISLGVGIILRLTGQPPPPVRPTAGLNSIGFEVTF